jgi:acyl carrier protein
MTISSRTPEGSPNRCPVCGADVVLEPSQPFGDAPCPSCGHLLWFVISGKTLSLMDAERAADIIRAKLTSLLGIHMPAGKATSLADLLADISLDSLDLVEVALTLEEEFKVNLSEGVIEIIQSQLGTRKKKK